jgi:hypothetical protein
LLRGSTWLRRLRQPAATLKMSIEERSSSAHVIGRA